MNEITYSPGRLAKKIGMSRDTLMKHLQDTGLIHQCFQMENGYWRIPYKVVIEIAGPEVLATSQPPRRKRTSQTGSTQITTPRSEAKGLQQATHAQEGLAGDSVLPSQQQMPTTPQPQNRRVDILTRNDDSNEHYAQVGKVLRRAGVTMSDLVREYEEGKEEKNES